MEWAETLADGAVTVATWLMSVFSAIPPWALFLAVVLLLGLWLWRRR